MEFSDFSKHSGLQYLDSLEIWKGGGGFDLERIRSVLALLGNPQDAVRSIHVTGTNGKGTVSAVISSILGAAGYSVGLNISPHLEQLNERIVVDGLPIAYDKIGEYALAVKEASVRADAVLSFHEGITATAFLAFRELGVDWIVMEVGLGGRLDASNVICCPEVAVITSVDLDHQHILGDTKEKIAYEKGGIIKKGCKVVVGALDPLSLKVIETIACEKSAYLSVIASDFSYTSIHDGGLSESGDIFDFSFKSNSCIRVTKHVRGSHQLNNFSVALAVAKLVGIADKDCIRGAGEVFWPSRLEVFNWKKRIVIMDCAHNPHGVKALVENLSAWGIETLDIAFGVLDTKNWQEMVTLLAPFAKSWNLLSVNSERALNINMLSQFLSGNGINFLAYNREMDRFIRDHESRDVPLLVTGSIYLIGELRKMFGLRVPRLWHKY